MRLKDKVAIVTGGSRGIGRATCVRLAKEGAKVVVNYADEADKGEFAQSADKIVKEISSFGGDAFSYEANVADKVKVDKMVDFTVKKYGTLDILVANAGICPFKEFLDIDEKLLDLVIGVNQKGAFFCAQAAMRKMIKLKIKGRIIFTSSVSAIFGGELQAHYCATKGAINQLMKSIAIAAGKHGITSNAVLRACADLACPSIGHPPSDDDDDDDEEEGHSASEDGEDGISGTTCGEERWVGQSITDLLGDALYTMAFERVRLELRTTWRWTSQMLLLCPWGREKPFHIIPAHDIDLRAKEALAGLIPSRAFSTAGAYTITNTCYASSFRFNDILQRGLDNRGRPLLIASFLMLIAAYFKKFCLVGTRNSRNAGTRSGDESRSKQCLDIHLIRASLIQLKENALKRASVEKIQGYERLSTTLTSCVTFVLRCYDDIVKDTGVPRSAFPVVVHGDDDDDTGGTNGSHHCGEDGNPLSRGGGGGGGGLSVKNVLEVVRQHLAVLSQHCINQ